MSNSQVGRDMSERMKELVSRAIALPADQRRAFIVSACAGDANLALEVQDLVSAHDAAGGFMASPTRPDASLAPAPTSLTPGTPREGPGARVGPYKLLELIGEGGFGAVYMADQDSPVRRRVALKIIKLGMDTRSVVARFEKEREALALMDHPNIARVLDAGATESGRPYFVMEYVKGDNAVAFADAHRLPVRDRLDLFTQVCAAVQHAHTKGIIHRDLKPGNVLVSMVDGRPFAKVIDFGIAKATGSRLTDKTLFTEHRQLIGTPEYMSPEQAEGSPDIDTRTDVYGLGVLLYELLTGLTPFDARRLRSAAFAEMQRIIKEEEPLAPSLRLTRDLPTLASAAASRRVEPARLGALVRGELDWIVLKSLDKDRARRYDSAGALADDVRRHLTGEPLVAAPPSAAYRLRKFVRRNRGPVAAVGAVAAALVLGIAGTTAGYLKYKAEAGARFEENRRLVESTELGRSYLAKVMNELSDGRFGGSIGQVIRDDGADVTYVELWANVGEAAIDNIRLNRKMRQEAEEQSRKLEAANTSLARQRNAAIDTLSRLACGLAQEAIDSGQIDLAQTDPPGYISFIRVPSSPNEARGAIIRINEQNRPELVFFTGSLSDRPLRIVDSHDIDPDLVILYLNKWVEGAIAQIAESRRAKDAANALLFAEVKKSRLAEAELLLVPYVNCETPMLEWPIDPLQAALMTRRELLGDEHLDTAKARWLVGAFRFSRGDLDGGLADMRSALTTTEAQPVLPLDLAAAMCDNLLHAELVMGNLDEATAIAERLRKLIASPVASEGKWTASGYGPFKPHYLDTPRLFTWQEAFVQTSHVKAVEIMRRNLDRLDRDGIETRYRPVIIRDALFQVARPIEQSVEKYVAPLRARAVQTAIHMDGVNPDGYIAMALMQYRLGKPEAAVEPLAKGLKLRTDANAKPTPFDAAAQALICYRLGGEQHRAEARAALFRARAILSDPANAETWAKDLAATAIVREAEKLIEQRARTSPFAPPVSTKEE